MEMKSSVVKYTWPKALNESLNEPVTIRHYKDPVAVMISVNEYKRLTGSEGHSSQVGLAEEVPIDETGVLNKLFNGERFKIKSSKQANAFILDNIHDSEKFNRLIESVCDKHALTNFANTDLYIKEVDGLIVIYTLSGVDIHLAHIHKLKQVQKKLSKGTISQEAIK